MPTPKQKPHHNRARTTLIAGVVVALVVIGGVVLGVRSRHTTNVAIKITPVLSPTPHTSTTPTSKPVNPSSGTSASVTPVPSVVTAPTATPAALNPPTGQLLSSTNVSLSANTGEESVCQTVIGASCTIILVSPSGQSVSFTAPAIDSQGGHLIDWSSKQYLTTTGAWKIYAQASLNGQTSSSPMYPLTVNS